MWVWIMLAALAVLLLSFAAWERPPATAPGSGAVRTVESLAPPR